MPEQELKVEIETVGTFPQVILDEAAKSHVLVLIPESMEKDGTPVFTGSTTSVRKLLHEQGVLTSVLPATSGMFRENRSLEWAAPTMFLTFALYSQNPALVDVALNVISSYIYEVFRGREKETSVSLNIVCFRGFGLRLRRVKYRGPVEGLKKVPGSVKQAMEQSDE